MKIKNISVIILIIILFFTIVSIEYFVVSKNKNIYAVIDNKKYTINEIKNEYGSNFITKISNNEIIVFNGETTYSCRYNTPCEIWPNSKGGVIMWAAPLVTITFKKEI